VKTNLVIAVLVVFGILGHVAAWRARPAIAACGNDFPVFYAGAKLLGTPQLYSPQAAQAIMQKEVGCTGPASAFIRLPYFAVLVWPLTLFPMTVAFAIWRIALVAAEIGFIASFGSRWKWALLACAWSYPLAWDFDNGQDSSFLLLWIAAAAALMARRRDFSAGLCFSLCAAKFHLMILLPLLLIARHLGRVAAGAVAGGTVLLAASFVAAGWSWPRQFAAAISSPNIDPYPTMEHNIRGTVGGRLPLEIILGITVAAAVWYICRRAPMPVALSSVVAGGVLVGHHLTVSDSALLLFPCLILAMECLSWAIRIWAILLISPVAVALAQTPALEHLPDLALLGLLYFLGWRLSRPERFRLRETS
jgi:hypothetical protein